MPDLCSRRQARDPHRVHGFVTQLPLLAILSLVLLMGCGSSASTTDAVDDVSPQPDTTAETSPEPDTVRTTIPRYVPRRGVAVADPDSPIAPTSPSTDATALPGATQWFLEAHGIQADDWPFLIGRGIVRLPGCNGAVASAIGLVITSYSCVQAAIGESNPQQDGPFVAATRASERPIEDLSVQVVIDVVDVSAAVAQRIAAGTDTGAALASVRDSLVDRRPERSVTVLPSGDTRFVAVVLHRHDDVRLVFLPHREVAEFGGELDAGSFPQYKLDAAVLRVYERGQPAVTPWYYAWDGEPPADGAAVFAIGVVPSDELIEGVAPDAGFGPLWVTGGAAEAVPSLGTNIPARVSFFGMYDRYHAFGAGSAWNLPEAWVTPAPEISLTVPFTLAVTNAPVDGMLGGPLLDESRRIRGVIYDTNHEMAALLPADIQPHRAVVLTSAALSEALRSVYEAEHIVRELESGTLSAD